MGHQARITWSSGVRCVFEEISNLNTICVLCGDEIRPSLRDGGLESGRSPRVASAEADFTQGHLRFLPTGGQFGLSHLRYFRFLPAAGQFGRGHLGYSRSLLRQDSSVWGIWVIFDSSLRQDNLVWATWVIFNPALRQDSSVWGTCAIFDSSLREDGLVWVKRDPKPYRVSQRTRGTRVFQTLERHIERGALDLPSRPNPIYRWAWLFGGPEGFVRAD